MPKHTTLRIQEALLRRARDYARRHDVTVTAVMERALTAYLATAAGSQPAAKVKLPVFGRGGLRKGVDLDDTSALLDLMDGIE